MYTHDDYIEMYDDFLDDCYEPLVIGGATYYASDILKSVDPIFYDMGLNEYIESLEEDIEEDDE